jgi:hypothetical protein
MKKYYLDNRERYKERHIKHMIKNREKRLEYSREYYRKNKQKFKDWIKNNPEKVKAHYHNNKENRKIYIANNIDKIRSYKLMHNYNIDIVEYYKMLAKQKNKCAICGMDQSESPKILCVDHNHKTGKVRGLLCKSCNLFIGNAHDNIDLLKNAIRYLRKYYDKKF